MKHIRTINEEFENITEGKIARYQIGNKEVTRAEVLDHMYNSKKEAGMKWKQTNSPKTQKDITKLIKQYGEGNVAIHGLTNGGDPVADVFVKESLNEGFSEWEMSFAPMVLSGVKLDPKNVYKVKARSTVEAIKKAAKAAGLSGNDWMATVTNKLEKLK